VIPANFAHVRRSSGEMRCGGVIFTHLRGYAEPVDKAGEDAPC
jgi:hypothetical protein